MSQVPTSERVSLKLHVKKADETQKAPKSKEQTPLRTLRETSNPYKTNRPFSLRILIGLEYQNNSKFSNCSSKLSLSVINV